jgi:2-aminoadipate transaminase
MNYQDLFSKALSGMSGNIIREITKVTQQPGFTSLAGGSPSPDCFPARELQEIAAEVIEKKKIAALQYGASEGYLPLREWIAGWVKEKGINATLSQVIITSGSQQGIDLLAKTFLDPGNRVLVENPTYIAAIKIFSVYQSVFEPVFSDGDGIIPESLEEILNQKACKLLYLIPNFQNPSGVTLTAQRRKAISEIVSRHNLILLEDDPYGELRYSGEMIPPMKASDPDGRVVYMGSFSKIICPGLRVAFSIGAPEIMQKVAIGKQNTDMHTSNLSQLLIYEFCSRGLLPAHIEKCCNIYRKKRDMMLELLETHFPAEVSWTKPAGGIFIWAKLPAGVSSMEILKEALKEKLAFIPGEDFFASGGGSNTMRFNFCNITSAQMEDGILRLGQLIKRFLTNK